MVAKQKIENLSKHLKYDDVRQVELLNKDIEPTYAYVELRIKDIRTATIDYDITIIDPSCQAADGSISIRNNDPSRAFVATIRGQTDLYAHQSHRR